MTTMQIDEVLTEYLDAFNARDLEAVIGFFSDTARYEPGDGKTHVGKAAIKAALEPQFNDALGRMRFDELGRVIDSESGGVALRWVCRHDISRMRARDPVMALRKLWVMLAIGPKFGWIGVDVLHFNADMKIQEKYTYGTYGTHPLIRRSLG